MFSIKKTNLDKRYFQKDRFLVIRIGTGEDEGTAVLFRKLPGKNKEKRLLEPVYSTTLVKTVGTIPVFPHPPIAMLICHGLRNQDPFIDRSHVSTLSGGEGGRKKGSERRKRIAHIAMEVCAVNFLLFAKNLTSVPKSFDPDCRYSLMGYFCVTMRSGSLLHIPLYV